MNTTGENYAPNGEKFREVAEAYAVLSVRESKLDYDFRRTKTPKPIIEEKK